MALETVTVAVLTDEVVPQPVDGVVVRVFDETGTDLITFGITDDGEVEFTLPGDDPPTAYQLRFFISGGSIRSPQMIEVYSPASASPTETNSFAVEASLLTLPTATNPRLCRVSGYVLRPDGRAQKGLDIHFVPLFNPLVVDGQAVLGERVATRTDLYGYAEIDLFRKGMYQAVVESHENVPREIVVPDRSSVGLAQLLFPVVASITYDPEGDLELDVGEEVVLTPTVTATDYRVLDGPAAGDLLYAIEDPTVASVGIVSNTLVIRGLSAGTTVLQVTRRDPSIVYLPDTDIDGGNLQITVS